MWAARGQFTASHAEWKHKHYWNATDPVELYDSHSVQCNEYKKVQHLPKNRHFTLRCYNRLLLFSTNQSQVHNILKSWGFSPRSAEMLFGPRASLPVFWNCASVLWGVQLLLRDPSSCSSTWWSCHRHPRRYPPQKQAGAWGPWLSSWCLLLLFFFSFFSGAHTVLQHVLRSNCCESKQSGLATQSVRAALADLLSLWLTGCSAAQHCPAKATLYRFTQMPIETLMPQPCVCILRWAKYRTQSFCLSL